MEESQMQTEAETREANASGDLCTRGEHRGDKYRGSR
jgi:hypothetical protein